MKALLRPFKSIVKFSQILQNNNRNLSLTRKHETEISTWGSKKAHRKIKLKLVDCRNMADPKIEEFLGPLRQQVKEQVS